jgi:ArsR family transcriptional regulator, cadmium/lead-responsive transcriptional repressor
MKPSAAAQASVLSSSPFQLPASPTPVDVLAKYFRAFADPTRLTILQLVAESERSVGELVTATGQSQPKVSNHLACLRWCGFVATRREHRRVYYSIADPRVTELLALAGALLEDNAEHVACCGVLNAEAR